MVSDRFLETKKEEKKKKRKGVLTTKEKTKGRKRIKNEPVSQIFFATFAKKRH